MLLLFKLAVRNLTRNPIRTSLNLIMIVGGFCSIILFEGFAHYMLESLEKSFVQGVAGQIQIAKAAIWEAHLPKNKEDAYIKDYLQLENELSKISEVLYSYGRANAYVLLSNADKTVGALAIGYETSIAKHVEKSFLIQSGQGFSHQEDAEILVSSGLQKQLNLVKGQTLALVSQTLGGSMSSVDPEVRGVVSTGLAEVDNSVVYLPLRYVQKLLETDSVERISLFLKPNANVASAMHEVNVALKDRPDLVAKDWTQSATFFRQLKDFYKVQNTLVKIILSFLIFFGILNTVGMSIYERVGEIGTMRALGDQRDEVLIQLVLEGLFLGLLGSLIATPISYLLAIGLSALNILILLPGASLPSPVHIHPQYFDYFEASVLISLTCLISTMWPAVKAIRFSIVEALRTNS